MTRRSVRAAAGEETGGRPTPDEEVEVEASNGAVKIVGEVGRRRPKGGGTPSDVETPEPDGGPEEEAGDRSATSAGASARGG